MENISNVSSEEELLQLRNEGKISEADYQDLLGAMKKTAKVDTAPGEQNEPKPTRTSGLAIASLVFSLIGPVGSIPAVICGHIALRRVEKTPALKGRGLALAGLIIGYTVFGLSMALAIPILLPILAYHKAAITPPEAIKVTELKRFPLDNMEGLLTQSGLQIDKQISSDGNGSLRIEATEPATIRLFETGDIDVENARLIYQAQVRTKNAEGPVYLEMWCHFPSKGEFVSRGLANFLTGTTYWTTQVITFRLKRGENPDNVKLNLIIDGKGTVWIDDIQLSAPDLNSK
jgi:hypothetical protein